MLDFRVHTFLEVCQTLNYTHAAQLLNITQPAVSQHISYLEREYGVKLFDYHNKKMRLTEEGEVLRCALASMAHDEALLKDRLVGMSLDSRIHLSLGMTLTAGEYVVAPLLAQMMAHSPQYRITLRSGGTAELLELLERGQLDCAFIEGFFDKENYAWDIFKTDRLVCVCGAQYQFEQEPLTIEDVLKEPLFVREAGSGTRAVLQHELARHNLSVEGFRQVNEVESLDIIKVLIAGGLGISFLYESAIQRELAEGTLRTLLLSNFLAEHDIAFIRLKESLFETEFQGLFDALQELQRQA